MVMSLIVIPHFTYKGFLLIPFSTIYSSKMLKLLQEIFKFDSLLKLLCVSKLLKYSKNISCVSKDINTFKSDADFVCEPK